MELPGGTPKVEKAKGSNRQTFSARRKSWSTYFGTFQNWEFFASNDPQFLLVGIPEPFFETKGNYVTSRWNPKS